MELQSINAQNDDLLKFPKACNCLCHCLRKQMQSCESSPEISAGHGDATDTAIPHWLLGAGFVSLDALKSLF